MTVKQTFQSVAQKQRGGWGLVSWVRWAWRQLTTMRAALLLLLVLALAAVPGSIFPQRIQDPIQVNTYIEENGRFAQILDALQLFDVYSSVWFSAVYILLMVSLVGCIVPRTKQHLQAMMKEPPQAPRRLSRMPSYSSWEDTIQGASREDFLRHAQQALKKRGYRTRAHADHIAAERGYLKETGNLVFHISILAVVIIMALGSLLSYSGQRVLVEGETFTNSLVSYDSFDPGTFFDPSQLGTFRLTLEKFVATFDDQSSGSQFGQPRKFAASMQVTQGGESEKQILKVNEPIHIGDSRVYLTGNGYAPVITVRTAAGKTVFSEPVVFLPQDGHYTSRGVVKVPDAKPDQLGFVGLLFPTAGYSESGEITSKFAELRNPYMVMSAYHGDLQLDEGQAQSVYDLDASQLDPIVTEQGKPLVLELAPGETVELPDNMGSVTWEDTKRFVALDIRHDPTHTALLVSALAILTGLGLSLFVPRRRMWVRISGDQIEVAALARGHDPRVEQAVRELAVELHGANQQPRKQDGDPEQA